MISNSLFPRISLLGVRVSTPMSCAAAEAWFACLAEMLLSVVCMNGCCLKFCTASPVDIRLRGAAVECAWPSDVRTSVELSQPQHCCAHVSSKRFELAELGVVRVYIRRSLVDDGDAQQFSNGFLPFELLAPIRWRSHNLRPIASPIRATRFSSEQAFDWQS
jgi:hypothetical protein